MSVSTSSPCPLSRSCFDVQLQASTAICSGFHIRRQQGPPATRAFFYGRRQQESAALKTTFRSPPLRTPTDTYMKSKLMVRLKEGKRSDSTLGACTTAVRTVTSNR